MQINKSNFQIYAVDDDPEVLDALQFALEASGWKVKICIDAKEFLDSFDPTAFGCIILDVRMPEITGPEVQQVLNERSSALPIIFLSGHGDMNTAINAFRLGALDFLQKPVDLGELIGVLERAMKESIQNYQAWEQSSPEAKYARLTDRQKQVLKDLAYGLEGHQIAEHLNISVRTLQRHRQNVMKILNLHSVEEVKLFVEQVQQKTDQ